MMHTTFSSLSSTSPKLGEMALPQKLLGTKMDMPSTPVDSVKFGKTADIEFNEQYGTIGSAVWSNDVVIVPVYQTRGKFVVPKNMQLSEIAIETIQAMVKESGFTGKAGEQLTYRSKPKNQVLTWIGLGERAKTTPQKFKTIIETYLRGKPRQNMDDVAVFLPPATSALKKEAALEAIVSGAKQATYRTPIALDSKIKKLPALKTVSVYTGQNPMPKWQTMLNKALAITTAVSEAKDRANIPYDHIIPNEDRGMKVARIAEDAKALDGKYKNLRTTVQDHHWVKSNAPLLWAVGRGAEGVDPPKMIKVVYEPENLDNIQEEIALVGKGIMYDTGGVISKQDHMNNMSKDMSGGAYVLAAIEAIAKLKPANVRVTAYVPAAFNAMDEQSYVPDAVLQSDGLPVVKMDHPDAEGRLALAEALKLAKWDLRDNAQGKEIPQKIISIATLTGAARAAVGPNVLALADASKPGSVALQAQIQKLAKQWDEPFESLPIEAEDFDSIQTKGIDYAEISNIGSTRGIRGSQGAGAFLNASLHDMDRDPFLGDYLHLDMAGVMDDKNGNATAHGERTLIDYVMDEDQKLSTARK